MTGGNLLGTRGHHDHHVAPQIAVMGFILLSGLAKLVFHRAHWLSSRVGYHYGDYDDYDDGDDDDGTLAFLMIMIGFLLTETDTGADTRSFGSIEHGI